jgi:lipase chaperone LimK
MKLKGVVIASAFIVAISISFLIRNKPLGSDYIMQSSSARIKIGDVDRYRMPTVFPRFQHENPQLSVNQVLPEIENEEKTEDALKIAGYFKKINGETLKYLRFLDRRFQKSTDLEEYMEQVLRYLKTQLSPADAERAFDIYTSYLDCEMELETESAQWDHPVNAEGRLELLVRIQDFRRQFLGADLADALYGIEVKSNEYSMRRSIIAANEDLYGIEKEELIERLNTDMWGEKAELMEKRVEPYQRYRQKIDLYSKDFSEISKDEKDEMILAFRESIFSDEIVERLEKIDAQISAEKMLEREYFDDESEILANDQLTEVQKTTAVDRLREEIFEGESESFLRRENIRKGLEQLINDGPR